MPMRTKLAVSGLAIGALFAAVPTAQAAPAPALSSPNPCADEVEAVVPQVGRGVRDIADAALDATAGLIGPSAICDSGADDDEDLFDGDEAAESPNTFNGFTSLFSS